MVAKLVCETEKGAIKFLTYRIRCKIESGAHTKVLTPGLIPARNLV